MQLPPLYEYRSTNLSHLSQCFCSAGDIQHLAGDTLLAGLLYSICSAPTRLVALSVAFFIATMRAACSLASDSRIAWYTCNAVKRGIISSRYCHLARLVDVCRRQARALQGAKSYTLPSPCSTSRGSSFFRIGRWRDHVNKVRYRLDKLHRHCPPGIHPPPPARWQRHRRKWEQAAGC